MEPLPVQPSQCNLWDPSIPRPGAPRAQGASAQQGGVRGPGCQLSHAHTWRWRLSPKEKDRLGLLDTQLSRDGITQPVTMATAGSCNFSEGGWRPEQRRRLRAPSKAALGWRLQNPECAGGHSNSPASGAPPHLGAVGGRDRERQRRRSHAPERAQQRNSCVTSLSPLALTTDGCVQP